MTDTLGMTPLPDGVTYKPWGRFPKLGWAQYNPVGQYHLSSGMTVVPCDHPDWLALLTGGVGEFHVMPITAQTARRMVEVIRDEILSEDAQGQPVPRARAAMAEDPKKKVFDVGDDIRFAYEWWSWGFKKLHQGMAPERLKPADLRVLVQVLERILTQQGTDDPDHVQADLPG